MKEKVTYFTDPHTGRRIHVGSFLVMIADSTIGRVMDMYRENGLLSVVLCQPSGRLRIRSLEHDLDKGFLVLMDLNDAHAINNLLKSKIFDKDSYPNRIVL